MCEQAYIPSPIADAQMEYICQESDNVTTYKTDDYIIGYTLSGSCKICGKEGCREVAEHKLFVVEKGDYRIEQMIGRNGRFEQILLHLAAEKLFGYESRDDSRQEARFERAVLDGIVEGLTIEELADNCCLSLSTFKRHFRSRFSESPHRWFVRCRLDLAERVLSVSGISVLNLAQMCGYSNTSHFIHAFRSRFGATPSHFVRQRYSRRYSSISSSTMSRSSHSVICNPE